MARERPYRDALRMQIAEMTAKNQFALRGIAFVHIQKALEGDLGAIKELADRLDGKVSQPIKGDDEDDTAIRLEIIKRIIVGSDGNEKS